MSAFAPTPGSPAAAAAAAAATAAAAAAAAAVVLEEADEPAAASPSSYSRLPRLVRGLARPWSAAKAMAAWSASEAGRKRRSSARVHSGSFGHGGQQRKQSHQGLLWAARQLGLPWRRAETRARKQRSQMVRAQRRWAHRQR